jgi:hypothetical protein
MLPLLEAVARSRETVEAHLAADVAAIAYEDARLTLAMVERGEIGLDRHAVSADAERARERLASAKARYREQVLRDAAGSQP